MALPVPGHLENNQFSSEFARIPWLLETFTVHQNPCATKDE
jgi:hypothetical protein